MTENEVQVIRELMKWWTERGARRARDGVNLYGLAIAFRAETGLHLLSQETIRRILGPLSGQSEDDLFV